MMKPAALDSLLTPDGPMVACLKARFPNIPDVWAFGSLIRGTPLRDGDLGLALLVAGYAPAMLLWDTASVLTDLTGCPVDLLDLRLASTVMQHQVIATGRCLWAHQPDAGQFELFASSEKLASDDARSGLQADIQKTGTIYGR